MISTCVTPRAKDDDGKAGCPLIRIFFFLKRSLNSVREIFRKVKLRFCFRNSSRITWSILGFEEVRFRVSLKEFLGCGGSLKASVIEKALGPDFQVRLELN